MRRDAMKIQAIDTTTKQPLTNQKLQIQVKGKDSGYLSLTTDGNGYFQLDDKYNGQQIALSFNGTIGTSITATDGAKLAIQAKTKEGTTR